MIGPLLSLFKGFSLQTYISMGLGAVVVALGIYIAFLKLEVSYKTSKIETLNAELLAEKTKLDRLFETHNMCLEDVKEQNNKIDNLIQSGEKIKSNIISVQLNNKEKDKKIKELLEEIIKKPAAQTCEGSMNELNEFMKEYRKQWNKN